MAQIFQPELTDSFEIKSNTVSQSDNVMKTVQEIYNYGVNSNYGNCFILYDNANNFLQNKGGYQIRYFYLTSLLTPKKIYLGSSNYLYNNGVIAGGTKKEHAIGVAVQMRSGEYETINVATLSFNGNSYSIIVNTNENFTTSTGGLSATAIYVNEDAYGSDYYTSYYGSGLHSGYDEVIYIDPSIYDELYIDGQLVPKANATIRVNYYLPDDDYKYARITYKKNEKPESVNDGTIVSISPNDSYVDIPKFVEGQSYWFKIFTDKSESEAFPYTVEPAKSKIITVWDYQNNIKTNVLRNGETEQSFYLWSDNYLYCYRDTSRYGLYVSNNTARIKITKGYSDPSIAPYSNNIAVLRMTIKVDNLKSQGAHYLGISVNAVGTKRSGNYDAIMGCNCIQGDDYSKYVVGETFTWEGYWDIQYWIDNNIPFLTDGFKLYIDSGVKDTITFRVYKIEIECCEGEILG